MNERATLDAPPVTSNSIAPTWKVVLAVILGPCCVLLVFLGEALGVLAGFGVLAASFLLVQYILSRGLGFGQSRRLLLALNSLPFCLGLFAIVVEQKSGAWWQGVLIIVLSLTGSLAGAALASRSAKVPSTSVA